MPPVLKMFYTNKQFTTSCDFSQSACTAVLLQGSQPVVYMSKPLPKTLQNYAPIEKEMLAIAITFERFHQYIYEKQDIH